MISFAVADTPTIPFGFRPVVGQSQKGDGIWNGRRFAKVKKGYPFAGDSGAVIIRRCEVVQPALPGTEQQPEVMEWE